VISKEVVKDESLKYHDNWTRYWAGSFYGTVQVSWLIPLCELPIYSVRDMIAPYLPEVVASRAAVQMQSYGNQEDPSSFRAAKSIHVTEVSRDAGESFSKAYDDFFQTHNEHTQKALKELANWATSNVKPVDASTSN